MSAMSHVRDITGRQRRKEALTVGSKVWGDETARLSHRGTVGVRRKRVGSFPGSASEAVSRESTGRSMGRLPN